MKENREYLDVVLKAGLVKYLELFIKRELEFHNDPDSMYATDEVLIAKAQACIKAATADDRVNLIETKFEIVQKELETLKKHKDTTP